MASFTQQIVSFLEKEYQLRSLQKRVLRLPILPEWSGKTIAIVGGGLAGPAFARRVLSLAAEGGVDIKVELFTTRSCNFCAGLITRISQLTISDLYNLPVPSDIIRENIKDVVYMNKHGSVKIPLSAPMISVLRTSKFQQQGFDDSWLDSVFKGLYSHSSFQAHRNARVSSITKKAGKGFRISYVQNTGNFTADADAVVIASGVGSLQQPFMQKFMTDFGYGPPELMDACVTEVNTSAATHYDLNGRVMVVDGIIPNCIFAFIPKGRNWLTVTGLGKVFSAQDLEVLFNQRLVRNFIRLENVIDHLKCRKVCSASVIVSPAKDFFGDDWLMIGDLTGYGRVMKDGYFLALQSANLAAQTMLCQGASYETLKAKYYKPLSKITTDNKIGMLLFWIDQTLINRPIKTFLLNTARREIRREKYGGLVTAAFRALFTGELPYRVIAGLFSFGLLINLLRGGIFNSAKTKDLDNEDLKSNQG